MQGFSTRKMLDKHTKAIIVMGIMVESIAVATGRRPNPQGRECPVSKTWCLSPGCERDGCWLKNGEFAREVSVVPTAQTARDSLDVTPVPTDWVNGEDCDRLGEPCYQREPGGACEDECRIRPHRLAGKVVIRVCMAERLACAT